MKNKKIIILVASASLIVAIVLGIALFVNGDNKDIGSNIPEEYGPRNIVVEETTSGMKVATNEFDGYKIRIPSAWWVGEKADFIEGLEIFSEFDSRGMESFGGVYLNIHTIRDIEDVKDLVPQEAEFNEQIVGTADAYKASYAPSEFYLDDNNNPVYVPLENSGIAAYIFVGSDRYYVLRCVVESNPDYKKLLSLCEGAIKTFEIIK